LVARQRPEERDRDDSEPSTALRLEGDVLLEALQTVPTMWSALDRSNAPARSSDRGHTPLVDDPAWA
jgi:hypothetical protein